MPGGPMAALRAGLRKLADPPPHVVAAVDAFDPDRRRRGVRDLPRRVTRRSPAARSSPTGVRRGWRSRTRPGWPTCSAGPASRRAPSVVVPIARGRRGPARRSTSARARSGRPTPRRGTTAAAPCTRWVTDDDRAAEVTAELAPHCRAGAGHAVPRRRRDVDPRHRPARRRRRAAPGRAGHAAPGPRAALQRVRHVLGPARRGPRRDARPPPARSARCCATTVDFRGAFTLDGVATADGFRPTELNPRFGAGLSVITRGLDGVPLPLVLDLVVAGRPLGDRRRRPGGRDPRRRRRLAQRRHVAAARPRRRHAIDGGRACFDGTDWRWAADDEPADATVAAAEGFARAPVRPGAHPVGPSVGERSVAFWRFADQALGHRDRPADGPARRRPRRASDATSSACGRQKSCQKRGAASDRAAGGGPVLVLEVALVELAGRVAGELGAEVDGAWALDVGELRAAERDQLLGRGRRPRRRRRASRRAGRRP